VPASRLGRAAGLIAATGKLAARALERAARVIRAPLPVLYHVSIIALSAAIAASLPVTFSFAAGRLLAYWSFVQNERLFLISTEIVVAFVLILVFNHARTNWRNRTLSKMARAAGMVHVTPRTGVLARRTIRRSKERQAAMRDIMLIGSTGLRTFVDPKGDLHAALQTCRTAKIMLLDPESRGALERARIIPDPAITQESLRRQVREAIDFLAALRTAQKSIQLKLYPDPPLWKRAILGDYVWVQHYHPGLDVQVLPEYVFVHRQDPTSLFPAFYQHFARRWNDPAIPEYDLVKDELVYRDAAGDEVGRRRFGSTPADPTHGVAHGRSRRGWVRRKVARLISGAIAFRP
jgi:hypothetical protein